MSTLTMDEDQNDGNYNSDYDERALLEDCTDPEDVQKEKQHRQESIFLVKNVGNQHRQESIFLVKLWESTSPGEHLPS